MKNNQTIQTITELLNKYIEENESYKSTKEMYENYETAEKELDNDIFKLLDHTDLLIDTKIENNNIYLNLIETLKILKDNKLIELTPEQKQNIADSKIYKYCYNSIKYYKNKLAQKFEELQNSKTENNIILEMIDKLENLNDELIDEKLLEELFNILSNKKVDKTDIEKILYLTIKYNNEIFEALKEKELKEPIEKLTDEELAAIFEKYGFDYKKVEEEQKRKLRIKGNIQNIEEVFQAILHYSIPFKENNKVSISILTKSDKNAIETVYNLSQEYNIDFNRIIKLIPGVLIHKSTQNKIKYVQATNAQQISGSYEDFEENIKLIKEIGYDIKEVIKSTITIFTVSNKTLRKNVEELRKYGFPKNLKEIGFKLSGLKGESTIKNIDKFIELDEFEYIKHNTSRLCLEQTTCIFNRLYFAKKYNRQNNNQYIIKRKTKTKEILSGIICDEKIKTLDSIIDTTELEKNYNGIDSYNTLLEYLIQEERKGYTYEMTDDETINLIEKNNKINQIMYKFNDTIISRYKVQRIYSLLKKQFPDFDKQQLLLFAVTYNSILNQDEYNNIKNTIIKNKEKTK